MSAAVRQTFLQTDGRDPATGAAAAFARVELPGGCRDLLRAVAELQAGRPSWTGSRQDLGAAAGCRGGHRHPADEGLRRGRLPGLREPQRPGLHLVGAGRRRDRPPARPAPPNRRPPRRRRPAPAGAVAETRETPAAAPAVSRRAQVREGWASIRRGAALILLALLWPRTAAPVRGAPAGRTSRRRLPAVPLRRTGAGGGARGGAGAFDAAPAAAPALRRRRRRRHPRRHPRRPFPPLRNRRFPRRRRRPPAALSTPAPRRRRRRRRRWQPSHPIDPPPPNNLNPLHPWGRWVLKVPGEGSSSSPGR